jgi:hypothetical protein
MLSFKLLLAKLLYIYNSFLFYWAYIVYLYLEAKFNNV